MEHHTASTTRNETTLLPKGGMRSFLIIWIGQLISLIGSGLTGFALGVWIYESTGKATPFALTALFGTLPGILLSPLAGVVADRWNRRRIMILADTGAAFVTLTVAALIYTDSLQIWQIYLVSTFGSIFNTFQEPAYSASVTMMVPKRHLGRASGLRQGSQAVQTLIAPLLAGVLFVTIGLKGIIVIDFITYFFAVGALLVVHIPQPKVSEEIAAERGSVWKEAIFGLNYIRTRVGLLSMLIYFAFANFLLNISGALMTPLILSFADARQLGILQTILGAGMLVGSLMMGTWGGPKRKMSGVYGFIAIVAVGAIITGLQANAWVVAIGMFVLISAVPIASGCSQVIWQTKVEPAIQGRVFAIRRMIAHFLLPLAYILGGVLADSVFEPAMNTGGNLAPIFGPYIGTGPGRGIGLLFIIGGVGLLVVTLIAYANPRLRNVEEELPDVLPEPKEMATAPAD